MQGNRTVSGRRERGRDSLERSSTSVPENLNPTLRCRSSRRDQCSTTQVCFSVSTISCQRISFLDGRFCLCSQRSHKISCRNRGGSCFSTSRKWRDSLRTSFSYLIVSSEDINCLSNAGICTVQKAIAIQRICYSISSIPIVDGCADESFSR